MHEVSRKYQGTPKIVERRMNANAKRDAAYFSDKKLRKIGKFLAYVLRHKPTSIGLSLDPGGWAVISDLIDRSKEIKLTEQIIEEIVKRDDKQRFKISDDGLLIRASQGHSIEVDLGLNPVKPPDTLYQGTARCFVDSIMKDGIKKMRRRHVHLSEDKRTAINVGKRHGEPVVLTVDTGRMYKNGHEFFLSDNKVWLTDVVPAKYICTHS